MSLADADRIQLTSYAADGTADESTERIVSLSDTRIAFWVPNLEGWPERFQHSPIVGVRACHSSGKPITEEPMLEGRAEVFTEGPLFDEAKKAVKDKYGFGVAVDSFVDRAKEMFGGKTAEAVVLINIVG